MHTFSAVALILLGGLRFLVVLARHSGPMILCARLCSKTSQLASFGNGLRPRVASCLFYLQLARFQNVSLPPGTELGNFITKYSSLSSVIGKTGWEVVG